MKIQVSKDHCRGCHWLLRGKVCAFERCIRGFGWIADKKGCVDDSRKAKG